ncbi:MAG: hypothetical protein ACRD96_02275 [Bryobacteraceae bacterium]
MITVEERLSAVETKLSKSVVLMESMADLIGMTVESQQRIAARQEEMERALANTDARLESVSVKLEAVTDKLESVGEKLNILTNVVDGIVRDRPKQ